MKKYLVIQAARMGDLAQTKRLLVSLRSSGAVYLLIDKTLLELAKQLYPFAEALGVTFHKIPSQAEWRQDMDVFHNLAGISFSKIINCNYSLLTGAICRMFDDDLIAGYKPAHCMQNAVLRSAWTRLAFRISSRRILAPLNLVDFWAHFIDEPHCGESINMKAKGRGGGLGVAVSGREERRSLNAEILASIVRCAFNLGNFKKIKLFGAANEQPKARRLLRLLPQKTRESVTDFTGETTLAELNEEVSGLDLLLTPDTGIMHLAASAGVPVAAFFLSSAYCHETGPYGEGHIIYQAHLECSPCLETSPCPNRHKCRLAFDDPSFITIFAKTCFLHEKITLPSNGLQVWTPSFDDLGQKLELLSGRDDNQDIRRQIRKIIKRFLGLQFDEEKNFISCDEEKKLLEWLFPEQEWFFPAQRHA